MGFSTRSAPEMTINHSQATASDVRWVDIAISEERFNVEFNTNIVLIPRESRSETVDLNTDYGMGTLLNLHLYLSIITLMECIISRVHTLITVFSGVTRVIQQGRGE